MRTRLPLYAISFLTEASALALVFVVSRDLAESGAGLLKMGIVGGGLAFMHVVGSVISGRWSDRLGRTRFILMGQSLLLASVMGCYWNTTDGLLYQLFYWLAGLALGTIYAPLIASLTRGGAQGAHTASISRPLLRFCLSWNCGMIAGQVSSGHLYGIHHDWPFILAIVIATLSVILGVFVALRTPIPAAASPVPTEAQNQHRELSAAFARLCWISNSGHAFAMTMVFFLLPDLVVNLNISPNTHGILLGVLRGIVILTYLAMQTLTFWHHRFTVSLLAQTCGILGMVGVSLSTGPVTLMAGLSGLGMLAGYNYFASLYYSTMGAGEERRGLASGLHEATLGVGMAVGSVVGGLVGQTLGYRAPYLLSACLIFVLAVVQTVIHVRTRQHLPQRKTVRDGMSLELECRPRCTPE